MARKKATKKKVEVVFDPQKRKEFLTGFRKRKNERRNKAKEQLEKRLKDERKQIRAEVNNSFKHLKRSFQGLKELTEEDKINDEYEDDDVKIKIVELTTNDLASRMHFLGENRGAMTEELDDNEEYSSKKELGKQTDGIPGMDFAIPIISKNDDSNCAEECHDGKTKKAVIAGFKSKKELNRLTKIKTNKKLKKSKVFKIKERIEKKANQKQARREKNNTIKNLPKNQRKLKRLEPSRYRKGKLVNKKQMRRKIE